MKLIKGMICSVDPTNRMKQDAAGVSFVELEKRIKKKAFKNSVWECNNLAEDGSIDKVLIKEKDLYPANMSIVRNPVDLPTINSTDLESLKLAMNMLDKNKDNYKVVYNRLEMLSSKLKLCMDMKII